jgi:hypothetical protein
MFLMDKTTVPPLLFQTTSLTDAALSKDEAVCIIVQGPSCLDSTPDDLTSGDCASLLLCCHCATAQLKAITQLRMYIRISVLPVCYKYRHYRH